MQKSPTHVPVSSCIIVRFGFDCWETGILGFLKRGLWVLGLTGLHTVQEFRYQFELHLDFHLSSARPCPNHDSCADTKQSQT